jgi:ribulose bisphosphate carboxylase small subunit
MKATVFALALLWAGALFAQTPPATESRAAAHLDKLATLLDLTDAQKTQVQAVLQEEHAKIRAAHEQAMASGTKPDWQQMKALHEQIQQETLQELHTDMMKHGRFGHGGAPGGDAPPPAHN